LTKGGVTEANVTIYVSMLMRLRYVRLVNGSFPDASRTETLGGGDLEKRRGSKNREERSLSGNGGWEPKDLIPSN
jgi:hypothetical protein